MSTLNEVAKMAGVSVSTASRVLSGSGYASPEAELAVRAAAAGLGYVKNNIARSLRENRTWTLGLVIADIENSFYAVIARTMEKVARDSGFQVILCNSDESGTTEARLLQMLREMRVDGLLITPTAENADGLVALQEAGAPVVQIDRSVDGLAASSVLVDNEAALSQCVEYLVDLGHSRIVVISGPQSLTTGRERAIGARKAGSGHADVARVQVLEASFLKSEAIKTVIEALSLNPSAIVAGNNVVAEACMDVVRAERLRVPKDLSIVAFDDVAWMSWVCPPLTAIEQPVVAMARRATEILLSELSGTDSRREPVHVRLPTTLHKRESVADLRKSPPRRRSP